MSSGFITESEALDIRKKRQEEWEKVRTQDDPIERPEEVYDRRSLFERLQEQKQKKDLEYEEAHKLKNMIKGLDDDEIEFLDLVDRTKLAADRKKLLEEERELNDYRNRVASLQERTMDQKLHADAKVSRPKPNAGLQTQQKLLQGIVKKVEPKKRKLSETDEKETEEKETKVKAKKGLTCIGILPGLGCYDDSSSDDSSNSDSDVESKNTVGKVDMLGRKVVSVVVESKKEKKSFDTSKAS